MAPAGYRVLPTSVRTGKGIEAVKGVLQNQLSVFAGPSGVGKSSLLNAVLPTAELQTGEVSKKLGRGRHTTRHVEILDLPGGGQVADAPSFSQLSFRMWGDGAGEVFSRDGCQSPRLPLSGLPP